MDNFEFVYELNRSTNALNNYVDACIVEKSGLTRAQCVALMLVEQYPDITKAALARKLNSSHVAVGRLATILLQKGCIRSVPSKENPHTMQLRVTPEGEEMIHAVKLVFSKQSATLFTYVGAELDVSLLSTQLHAFAETLSTYRKKI